MSSKLRVVLRHEFLTIVRQWSFWISMVSVPLIIGAVLLIGQLTNSRSDDIDPAKNDLRIAVVDQSNLIVPDVAAGFMLTMEQPENRSLLEEQVKSGELDGLIVYPADVVQTGKYQIVANSTDEDRAKPVAQISRLLLQHSLLVPLQSQELAALAITGGETEVQTYIDGRPGRGLNEYLVPGSFLIIFYIVLIFSVSYALTSVSEEKENRSIEMVLSYVKPRTLILGKMLAVILVTLTQIAFFILLGIAAYLVARSLGNELSLPFNLSDLSFEPIPILFGLAYLIVGFIFFVGLMATIGAMFPSTKEASGFSSLFFILPAVPFWGFSAIVGEQSSAFTQFVTYFPLTSPTASLVRNAVGNLSVAEGLISLAILIATTIVTILLAGKAFRLGTLEYNSRIKLSSLLRK